MYCVLRLGGEHCVCCVRCVRCKNRVFLVCARVCCVFMVLFVLCDVYVDCRARCLCCAVCGLRVSCVCLDCGASRCLVAWCILHVLCDVCVVRCVYCGLCVLCVLSVMCCV